MANKKNSTVPCIRTQPCLAAVKAAELHTELNDDPGMKDLEFSDLEYHEYEEPSWNNLVNLSEIGLIYLPKKPKKEKLKPRKPCVYLCICY